MFEKTKLEENVCVNTYINISNKQLLYNNKK